MSIDMIFYAQKFNGKAVWDEEEDFNYPEELKEFEDYMYNRYFKSSIEKYKIGYFDSFYALHNYIVENMNIGEYYGQDIYIFQKDIDKLLEVLEEVSKDKNKAKELLPVPKELSLGEEVDYSEFYFNSIEEAIVFFKMLKDFKIKNEDYYIVYSTITSEY